MNLRDLLALLSTQEETDAAIAAMREYPDIALASNRGKHQELVEAALALVDAGAVNAYLVGKRQRRAQEKARRELVQDASSDFAAELAELAPTGPLPIKLLKTNPVYDPVTGKTSKPRGRPPKTPVTVVREADGTLVPVGDVTRVGPVQESLDPRVEETLDRLRDSARSASQAPYQQMTWSAEDLALVGSGQEAVLSFQGFLADEPPVSRDEKIRRLFAEEGD